MDKVYDIFLARIDGWPTIRVDHNVSEDVVKEWVKKGYKIETEYHIYRRLHEVYLVKS